MVRTKEGGSILGFVVIGGVLALLLIGGVYFVRQQAAQNAGIAPVTSEGTEPQPENNTQQNEEQAEQPAPAPETSQPNESETEAAPEEGMPPQDLPSTGASELPKTGPAETFAAITIFGLLSAITTAYVQSRRLASSLTSLF